MNGAVTGGVRALLRVEGLCILLISVLAYARLGSGWSTFAWFFLAPDLSFLAYLAGARVGAFAYNLAHSLALPLVLLSAGLFWSEPLAITAGLIWTAHIGLDRVLGYGLKYTAGFGFTHLGRIGRMGPMGGAGQAQADAMSNTGQ